MSARTRLAMIGLALLGLALAPLSATAQERERRCYFNECPDEASPQPPPDISGRYVATSSDRPGLQVVLDIQSGSEGTFSGTLAFPRGGHFIVEGRAIGDTVTFEARDPIGYDLVRFEGKFTGGSITGHTRIVSPSQGTTPWEPLEFAAGGADPGLAPQSFPPSQEMSAKLCCMGGLTGGWCESWSSRPGRLYAYENLTYAELGSACFCAGLTEPGHVDYCP
jgi:hypothetical protein